MILVALGWATFHGQLQFNILVNENNGIPPAWFLLVFFMAILASSLLQGFEQALKSWLTSLLFSVILVLILIMVPIALGAIASEFAPLIIGGSIQPIATVLILMAPINLLGCFMGQVIRNRLV